MSVKGKPQPIYSEGLKHHIIKQVITGNLSRAEAMRKFSIGSISTITRWMHILGYLNESPLPVKKKHPNPSKRQLPEDTLLAYKKQVKELKQRLHNEQLRSEFYQQVIDTAERELGVDIRKKYDAK